MIISFMGILLLPCALMLGFFSYRRYVEYRRDRLNTVNYHYWLAASFVSAGFFMYGLPSVIFPESPVLISAGTVLATVLNAIGFSNFLLIPTYSWLSEKMFTAVKYILYLCIAIVAVLLIILPPNSFLDDYGVIHWQFHAAESLLMMSLIGTAFILNIVLIWKNIATLRDFSYLNAVALILTFLSTGIGGGYLYVGDNHLMLVISTILLYIGISIIFLASVRTAIKVKQEISPHH